MLQASTSRGVGLALLHYPSSLMSLSKFQQAKRIVLDAQGQTITARLEYEVRGQLFANVDYVIVFDDALVVKD